jgi:GNAT superfamily N-acetyltransferase
MKYLEDSSKIIDHLGNTISYQNNGLWISSVDSLHYSNEKKKKLNQIIENKSQSSGNELVLELLQCQDVEITIYDQKDFNQFSQTQNDGDYTDLCQRIKYFHMNDLGYNETDSIFIVAKIDDYIVGLGKIRPFHHNSQDRINHKPHEWISTNYISVDPNFQHQGIGTQINEKIFEYASENNLKLKSSGYSEDGANYLKELNYRLAKKYGIEFTDSDLEEIKTREAILDRPLTDEEKKEIKFPARYRSDRK